ncbi:MAG: dipeptidase [Desulfitobacteriaceae bacterium]
MTELWVVDGHCDSLGDFLAQKRSLRDVNEGGHWDLERAKQGGVALQFLAAFIESSYKPNLAMKRGLELIDAAHRFLAENQDRVFLIRENKDLARIPHPDKIAVLLAVEGGEVVGESLFMLDIIYALGVRSLTLTWNQRNAIGDGAGEHMTGSRLTRFGQGVIKKMNTLGMLIDVSHLNEAGFWHVLERSGQPVVASHSCAKALCPHVRNLDDEQLRALARAGGVVGVNFYPSFLVEKGTPSRQDIVRHISHIAEVAGIEAVGLGSDFDGIEDTLTGLEDCSRYPALAEDLRSAGFTEAEIGKIFGKNFMRVLRAILK